MQNKLLQLLRRLPIWRDFCGFPPSPVWDQRPVTTDSELASALCRYVNVDVNQVRALREELENSLGVSLSRVLLADKLTDYVTDNNVEDVICRLKRTGWLETDVVDSSSMTLKDVFVLARKRLS